MIFNDIFCKTFNHSFFVFLCGGANKQHIRNKIRSQLEEGGFQVLYPEDLFMDMFNRNKKTDLLEYENLLANNADRICIICESMGSAVELGAFTQNENIANKLIVCINQKYSRDKSFIMMGPVKHLKKKDKSSVLTYKKSDSNSLGIELCKKLRHFQYMSKKSNKYLSFDNMSAYITFIPIIVYFYKTLKEQNKLPSKYNQLFNASIKYLIKSGEIVTKFEDFKFEDFKNDETLSLSQNGYNKTLKLLKSSQALNKNMLQDNIRCVILKEQLNN